MKLGVAGRCRLAGLLWLVAGVGLLARGFPFWQRLEGLGRALFPLMALLVGGAKGWLVFRSSARRNIGRIEAQPEPRWFWTVYPPLLYVFVAAMIGLGVLLRRELGAEHPWVIVLVYFSVGAALSTSSAFYFQAARRLASGTSPQA